MPNLATALPDARQSIPRRVAAQSAQPYPTGSPAPTYREPLAGDVPAVLIHRRRYGRRRAELQRLGVWGDRWVDPSPARAHLLAVLQGYEISLQTAAVLSGVGTATLSGLVYPAHVRFGQRLHRWTAYAVLDLAPDLDRIPDNALLTAAGTCRRLEGLAAAGWPLAMLDELAGLPVNTIAQWRRRRRVSARHARLVRDLYGDLSMAPGPSRLTARRAAAAGWAPPFCWDDESIDNPWVLAAGQPGDELPGADQLVDDVAVDRATAGHPVRLYPAEREAVARRLAGAGVPTDVIAKRLHVRAATVANLRRSQTAAVAGGVGGGR